MKILTFTLFLVLTSTFGFAQKTKLDSLKQALKIATNDSSRHNICVDLYFYYTEINRDSALFYASKRLSLAKKNNYKLAEAFAFVNIGYQYSKKGRYAEAFQNLLLSLQIAEDSKNEEKYGWRIAQFPISGKERLSNLAMAHYNLGILMHNTENSKQEVFHLKEGLKIGSQINHIDRQMVSNMRLSDAYLKMNQLDSALYFAKEADFFSKSPAYRGSYRGLNISYIGETYFKKGETKLAKKYYFEGLLLSTEKNLKASIAEINHKLIKLFLQENEKDSALIYALKNLEIIKSIGNESMETGTEYEDVYLAYQLNNQLDSAYKYQGLALVAKDSFYKTRIKNIADFQSLSLEETMRLENLEKAAIQTQAKIRTYTLLSVLAVLSIIGFILYRNNRQKQKANAILQEKNEEINLQKNKVEKALTELKATQTQLIQSEKLASLGELTAGIAHEIQNPLNFVNNFSELSVDLVKDLKEEIDKPEIDKQYLDELFSDLSTNQEKINLHGKRASSIVKGMLEHSRASTGVKELTDINKLVDEYLRLAYHGLRAKDKDFNANFSIDFDEKLPKIAVIPQDFGRVLLNLCNNAFYAVSQRNTVRETVETGHALSKATPSLPTQSQYQPTVTISTEKIDNQIIIKIKDNGTGMSEATKAKIFQPFFTTKPTGQGTGLGLSLAFDIITKGHAGTIEVESVEGEGTTFVVKLPI